LTLSLPVSDVWASRVDDPFQNPWGIAPVEVFVGKVMEGKPAEIAGIQENDRLYAVNGLPVKDFTQLGDLVAQSVEGLEEQLQSAGGGGCFGGVVDDMALKPLRVTVVRAGDLVDLEFTPVLIGEAGIATTHWRPLMGIYAYPDAWAVGNIVIADYSVPEAIGRGVHYTVQTARHILTSLGGILTGGLRVRDSVGGPVRIFSVTAQAWAGGLFSYVKLLAVISISLGIVNLLPVPVLDGGQILIYGIEGIRGRPVSPALRERMQMIGVLFLVALFLVVTFFDIQACITGQ
jgi:regulator of sigma E protease